MRQLLISLNILGLLLITPVVSATPIVQIEQAGPTSMTLSITVPEVKEKRLIGDGKEYSLIGLDEFGYLNEPGKPQLPFRGVSLAADGNIAITVVDEEVEMRGNYSIYPGQNPTWAIAGEEQEIHFCPEGEQYGIDSFYPESPIFVQGTQTYRGKSITLLGISPIQYNPITKEVKIYRKLTVELTYSSGAPGGSGGVNSQSATLLNNVIQNSQPHRESRADIQAVADPSEDILIVTIPEMVPAAEKLAQWQRMKGFDVHIESQASWSSESVKSRVHELYNQITPKPGYLLIIGDHEHVPAEKIASGDDHFYSDNYYVCTGGEGDYMPEMSRGRISVQNGTQAETVVQKIINYEKNPPEDESYYNTALGCSYFQDYDNGGPDGYADRAFVQVIERINNYLSDDHGYDTKRLYYANQRTTPQFWNNTYYSWGEAVPDYLKRPNFPWDSDADDIAAGINDGAFLVYHYDHGVHAGWGDPLFGIPHLDKLTNADKLPIVFSIDCLVGQFDLEWYSMRYKKYFTECFAEELLRKSDGGVAGIVAASTVSWSGWNDALLQGMIDAIYPSDKMILNSPELTPTNVTTHEPIYRIGDVLSQGLFRMTEMWAKWDGARYHYEMYHYFGDPTTPLWTAQPESIAFSGSEDFEIGEQFTSVELKGLSLNDGVATLFNTAKQEIVGKSEVINGSSTILFPNSPGVMGDSLVLTVTGQNYRPLILETVVSDAEVSIREKSLVTAASMNVQGNALSIVKPEGKTAQFTLCDLQGRVIESLTIPSEKSGYTIDLQRKNLGKRIFVARLSIGDRSISHLIHRD